MAAINLGEMLAHLAKLTIYELRGEWRQRHRLVPPKRLSRDLLIRGIAYKMQEVANGGLSKATLRKLEKIRATTRDAPDHSRPSPIVLKPGTKLIREWHGATHTVLVHGDGFEWRGQRYRSLSQIAREITRAHWSGPRFFGLRTRTLSGSDETDNARA